MNRSQSSARWLQRRGRDIYSHQANAHGWRSRAVFKLQEIDRKHRLLRPGMAVLDLGAAPGSWSQYAARQVGCEGYVVAVDLLPIEPLPAVHIVHGDVNDQQLMQSAMEIFPRQRPDILLSDMSPQLSGNASLDIPRALDLLQCALAIAAHCLAANRYCLLKTFHGSGLDECLKRATSKRFSIVRLIKPKASSPSSREVYVLARTMKNTERT